MTGGIIKINVNYPQGKPLKMWSLLMCNNNNEQFLYMNLAHELEEAVEQAWDMMRKQAVYFGVDPKTYTPRMWLSIAYDEIAPYLQGEQKSPTVVLEPNPVNGLGFFDKLFDKFMKDESDTIARPQAINDLMKKIIQEKNIKLFNKSMGKFNEQEIRYLKDQLKIKP